MIWVCNLRNVKMSSPFSIAIKTLLVSDLVGSTKLIEDLGDPAAAALFERHDRLARDLLPLHQGREIDKTDGFLLLFDRPWSAVCYALAYHYALRQLSEERGRWIEARIGICLGEVILRENRATDVVKGAKPLEVEGLAKPMTARLMSLAQGGQTLLTQSVFEHARRGAVGDATGDDLRWLAHGPYCFKGVKEPVEVFEVGIQGKAPLEAPLDSEKAQRVNSDFQIEEIWNVPFDHNPFFTGRDGVLAELHRVLNHRGTTALDRTQAICGLGGVGKTQIAVEYALRYRSHYRTVFWVHAETVNDLITGYEQIAGLLNLPQKCSTNQEDIVRAVRQWFKSHDSWLLVLDNADSPRPLKGYLPGDHEGHILLTSRNQVFGSIARPFAISELSHEAAKDLLLTRSHRSEISESEQRFAAEVAQELGCLPLALEQAGAYLEATGASFQEYLSGYRTRRLQLLGEETAPKEHPPVSTTWEMNFQEVEKVSKASGDMLRACAFLAPDNIPTELVIQGRSELGSALQLALENVEADELVIVEVLKPLRRFSLIQRDSDTQSFSVHRLIQEAVKDRMNEETGTLWGERVVQALASTFPAGSLELADWSLCNRLFAHGKMATQFMTSQGLATKSTHFLLNQLGLYAEIRGLYDEAEVLFRKALEMTRRLLGAEHVTVATCMNNLANLISRKESYDEAESLLRDALAMRRRLLGRENTYVAQSMNNLAELLRELGRHDEAEELYREALELYRRLLSEDDYSMIGILRNLGVLCVGRGKRTEGETLLREALSMARRIAAEHPILGLCLYDLSNLLEEEGLLEEAEQCYREALEVRQHTLGDNHIDVALSLSNFAEFLRRKGEYAEAELLACQALAIRRLAHGVNHIAVANTLCILSKIRLGLCRFAEAEKDIVDALAVYRESLQDSHWRMFNAESVLGACLTGLGRYDEAESPLTRSYVNLRDNKEVAPRYVQDAIERIVSLYAYWGKHESASDYRKLFIRSRDPGCSRGREGTENN